MELSTHGRQLRLHAAGFESLLSLPHRVCRVRLCLCTVYTSQARCEEEKIQIFPPNFKHKKDQQKSFAEGFFAFQANFER